MILISFGNSWEIFKSGNTFGCANGLENSSNDNARGRVLTFSFGVSFWVGVSDVVPFTFVWAVNDGADATTVGTPLPSVVVWVLGAVVWGTVAVGVGVVNTFVGLTGETGLVTLVGFVTDFTQLLDVVTQGCHTG